MSVVTSIFHEAVFRPLLNLLIVLYETIPGADLGVAIIALTVLTRIVFYPLSHKAIRSQKALTELQPKIKELQEKYKQEKDKQAKAVMELYQKEGVNPFSGCAPLLLQLPVFFALFQLFRIDFHSFDPSLLYSFVPVPSSLDPTLFGIVDLTTESSKTMGGIILAFSAGFAQFVQSKTLSMGPARTPQDKSQFSQMMQMQMTYFMPIFTVIIVWNLESGLALYWLVTSLFSVFQQWVINRKKS